MSRKGPRNLTPKLFSFQPEQQYKPLSGLLRLEHEHTGNSNVTPPTQPFQQPEREAGERKLPSEAEPGAIYGPPPPALDSCHR